MTGPRLKLYYDGACVFCVFEMQSLMKNPRAKDFAFIDVSQPGFDPTETGRPLSDLMTAMHVIDDKGQVHTAIDSFVVIYEAVGAGWLVAPLKFKPLRPFFMWAYLNFARHRYTISRLLGLKVPPRCETGVCGVDGPYGVKRGA